LREYVLPHLAELARSGRFVSWASTAAWLSRQFLLSRRELANRYAIRPLIPPSIVGFSRAVRDRDLPIGPLLRPALAATLRRHTRQSAIAELRRPLAGEREAHLRGITQPQYQLTLEIADKSAAAFGLEPRYPFFDRRVIEFCLGLPDEQKFADGWPRLLLRRAMEGVLPESVQWRSSKANLSPNFHRTFRAVDLTARQSFQASALSPYVRTDRLCDLDARFRRSPTPERMTREALVLFRAAVLQEWLDADGQRAHNADPEPVLPSPAAA
jgi:asparagine synthase (glutamine-hydrolysing)